MQKSHAGGLYIVRSPQADVARDVYDFYGTSSLQVPKGVSVTTVEVDGVTAARIVLNDQTRERMTEYLTMASTEDQATGLADLDLRTYDRIGPLDGSDVFSDEDIENLAASVLSNGVNTGDATIRIPAAYTYLGQFLAHDMTKMQLVPTQSGSATAVDNLRPSQVLDFGTLFDLDPEVEQPSLDWKNTKGAWLGPLSGSSVPVHRDLPRLPGGAPAVKDARNDVSVALSQMQVLLALYHESLTASDPQADEAAQQALTCRRLQSVVLNDYLCQIITPSVYNDIIANGRKLIEPETHGPSSDFQVSVEFASACFRFGHSMVRPRYYPWDIATSAEIPQLLHYAHNATPGQSDGLSPQGRMPAGWVQSWRRYVGGPGEASAEIMAAPIDMRVAPDMGALPARLLPTNEIPAQGGAPFSLALKTLNRGRALQLANAGQMITCVQQACAGTSSAATVSVLADDQFTVGDTTLGLDAPLWLYTLHEAEAFDGQLGPIAGRIVMETLHAAIELSPVSILEHQNGKARSITSPVTLREVVDAAFG